MRTEMRETLHADHLRRSHPMVLTSAALGVLVVAAAGVSGTIHFAGPRWVPHWKWSFNARTPAKVPATFSGKPRRIIAPSHGTSTFPFGAVLLWVVIGVAVVGAVVLFLRWWNQRPLREPTDPHALVSTTTSTNPAELEAEPNTPALRSGIEFALHELDERREPADAIVRAWLGLQETAEESGIVRQPAETATEFTSRILSRALVDDRAVRTLLRLYLRTRFGDHPVTIDDVDAVRVALQELIRTWPAPDALAPVGR